MNDVHQLHSRRALPKTVATQYIMNQCDPPFFEVRTNDIVGKICSFVLFMWMRWICIETYNFTVTVRKNRWRTSSDITITVMYDVGPQNMMFLQRRLLCFSSASQHFGLLRDIASWRPKVTERNGFKLNVLVCVRSYMKWCVNIVIEIPLVIISDTAFFRCSQKFDDL